jgi:hypothetical protein
MIVKIIFVYIDDDLYDEDIDNIETLKKRENRILNDPLFKKNRRK